MDVIQQTVPTGATSGASSNSSTNTSSALSSDFETFLLMLTTQMQNQDPLNPMESQEFALQLATFSGVEQQVRTNELLENMAGGSNSTGLAELANWVGMMARVEAPIAFDGAPIEIALSPDPGSDRAELIVKDNFGREFARQEVPLGADTVEWVGVDQNGTPMLSGTYNLELASISQGEVTSTKPVSHYSEVIEARQGVDGLELVFADGTVAGRDNVTALRTRLTED